MNRNIVVAVLLAAAAGGALAQGEVLRVVPHSNLSILDPVWTTAYMSRNHGYMIYDTLFGTDGKSQIKPQMVESWTESPDHRLWTFKLRKGLAFHDGAPVTGEDVVASLGRWGKRDAMGVALMTFVERMDSPSPDSFRIFLREPCGFLLEALGKPSSNVPFIMPKRVAETDAFNQIDDYTGSGPYVFKRDEFKPGDRAVYLKNTKYKPRAEPASGTTGGKNVYVDRVEWNLALRDVQAQSNALVKGEIDIIESLAFDHYESMSKEKGVKVLKPTLGLQYMCRFNHLHAPFNRAEVRRAALAAFDQRQFLKAQVGVDELYKPCASMFTCGTPYASDVGTELQARSSMRKAQDLLKQSGYDGTPVVLMKPTDLQSIGKLPDVAGQLMRQAGFKVDLQAMDWQTLVSRRAKKDAPSAGGWNMFCTAWVAPDIWSPVNNAALDARGDKSGWFGWPDGPKLQELRSQFMRETDEAKKKKLAEAIQTEAFQLATHAPLGEYVQPVATRQNISGVIMSGLANIYWNVKKN
ncbi:MAG: ABC transporter substrate-binding protein [Proteobacteria bacterium]|nr:ABC transporter substrate-binding protein [Pseudomonadota bacterium]